MLLLAILKFSLKFQFFMTQNPPLGLHSLEKISFGPCLLSRDTQQPFTVKYLFGEANIA